MLGTILVALLVLALLGALLVRALFGALPLGLPYNSGWGYAPGGVIGFILVIVIVLVLLGHI